MNKISLNRRRLVQAVPALALSGLAPMAWAQGAYPNRPLRVIVPQPPGGGFDYVARALGDRLSKQIGQSVVVENKPGSGTLVGTDAAAKADPDGYTLLMGSVSNIALNMGLYSNLSYDSLRDFEPVGLAVSYSYTLMARKDLPFKAFALSADAQEFMQISQDLESVQCEKRKLRRQPATARRACRARPPPVP